MANAPIDILRNGDAQRQAEADAAEPWGKPLPLGDPATPPFETGRLCTWMAQWVNAVAEATQTPPDLPAALALANAAAAIAGKFRVEIRTGWQEPTNLYFVVALLPGERKSAVFAEAIAPVVAHERQLLEAAAPQIAAAESEHRVLELAMKAAEARAAKETNPQERQLLRHEAKQLAQQLAVHVVPEPPQLLCDDVTPESLSQLLARQGGKILQASAEGTAFEIAKGRYSDTANFDVYLKGHSGDPLRTDRVGRKGEMVDQPAITAALAVQPDVIRGLADQAIMRGRGFLARWLYFMPASMVGRRQTAAAAPPAAVKAQYHNNLLELWRLPGAVQGGKPAAHVLLFAADADWELQAFERWLEPQLAEGEDLAYLAGWANKLAGAIARIAGVLHVAGAPEWHRRISRQTVADAIAIGRGYLLPHAQAAFGVMGADGTLDDAKALWKSVRQKVVYVVSASGRFSRRDCHTWNRRRFQKAEDLDPALEVLCEHYLIREVPGSGSPGRGRKGPEFEVNPLVTEAAKNAGKCTQRTQLDGPESLSDAVDDAHGDDFFNPFDKARG